MTDNNYTGRARITNKQTGATREGEVTKHTPHGFGFLEDGVDDPVWHRYAEFTIEPILPEIPSGLGDTFTAEVPHDDETMRMVLMALGRGRWIAPSELGEHFVFRAEHIDRATIESVITAKERGL